MAHIDTVYNGMVETLLREGFRYADKSRANIGMLEIPHYVLDIDITQGFPLLTTKKIYWKSFIHELIWMLSGVDNIDYLQENGVKIWDQDAYNFSGGSYVGRIYGAQWRSWGGNPLAGDQITKLIKGINRGDLYNRRQIVTAWNPAELDDMALPPCHWAFQVFPTKFGFGIKWMQRSCDAFLGIPFDIGLYAALGKLIENETDIPFTRLIGDLTCVHLYEPHIPLAEMQIARPPIVNEAKLKIYGSGLFNQARPDNLSINNFRVANYLHHEPIKAKMYAKVQ